MRLFETMLMVLSLGLLWHAIWYRKRPVRAILWGVPSMLAVIVFCHLVTEHGRWQMGFVYITVLLVLCKYVLWARRSTDKEPKSKLKLIMLSLFAFLLTIMAISTPILLPVFKFDAPTGSYKVGTANYTWTDIARKGPDGEPRTINVRIWYPADPSGIEGKYISDLDDFSKAITEQYGVPGLILNYLDLIRVHTLIDASFASDLPSAPLVFFSHGNMLGTRFTNSFQTVELASHGYIVAAVEHPGTAFLSVYPDGSYKFYEDTTSQLKMDYNVQNEAMIPIIEEQTMDIQFALAQLQKLSSQHTDSPITDKIDFSKIGIFGHSQGGAVAVNVLYTNAAFKAGIDLDGYLYGRERQSALTQPVLIMNGNKQLNGLNDPPEMQKVEEERRKRVLANKGYVLDIDQAWHLSFTDIPLYSPLFNLTGSDPRQVHRIINDATICFMNEHLKGDKTCERFTQPDGIFYRQ